jgi:hypothetical protein
MRGTEEVNTWKKEGRRDFNASLLPASYSISGQLVREALAWGWLWLTLFLGH